MNVLRIFVLIALVSCGAGSKITTVDNSLGNDQNVSKFEESKFGKSGMIPTIQVPEHLHKDFDFMGPSPIDYDTHLISDECVWEELCKFNLKFEFIFFSFY